MICRAAREDAVTHTAKIEDFAKEINVKMENRTKPNIRGSAASRKFKIQLKRKRHSLCDAEFAQRAISINLRTLREKARD